MNRDLHHTMTAQYAAPKVSGNGVVRWDGGVKCVLPSVKLCGAAAQDGTPTPDAPVMPVCNDGVFQAHGDTILGTTKLNTLDFGWRKNTDNEFGIPNLGSVKLDALTSPMVQALYNRLHKPDKKDVKPLSAKTIRSLHGVLHKALQQAVLNGYIRVNPTDACKPPRVVKKEIQPLDETQVSEFLKAIQGHPHEYLYKITLFSGMREGEVLGLTWDCVDLEHGTLLIKQQLRREQQKGGKYYFSPPKNNKSRVLSLAPSVVQLFRLQKLKQNGMRLEAGNSWEENNLIFSNQTGGFLSYRTVYDCFKRIVDKIGSPSTRFHDLRHTYAVLAIKSGDDIKTVQENLGHATAAFTLDVYGHVTAQMRRDSADRMEQVIKSVSAG